MQKELPVTWTLNAVATMASLSSAAFIAFFSE